jgi:hypothetical protein
MKYWAYVNNEILGPFEKEKLLELPSFAPSLLVCPQTPVGEKTEDWKEAATYPELSALIGSGGMKPAAASAAPAAQPSPAPAAGEAPHSISLKPLTGSSIDASAPQEHKFGGPEIAVNHLGKSGGEAAPAPQPAVSQPHQAAAAFDPISLSRIDRRSETISGQAPIQADGIAKDPQQGFGTAPAPAAAPAQAPSLEPQYFPSSQPAAAGAPVLETFARPAQAAAGLDKAAGDALNQKLDALARNAATKQDLAAAIDPFRMKLDQIGEVVSSMRNQQFQREVMDKLAFLENAIREIKSGGPQAAAPVQTMTAAAPTQVVMEKNSDTVFGVQPKAEKPAEKPKEAPPAKDKAKGTSAIVDTGSKKSSIGPMLRKLANGVITLVLLVAVLFGAVIGLKNFGVFDATRFIPFPLPFVGGQAKAPETAPETQPAPAAAAQQASAQPQSTQTAQGAQPAQPQQPKAPDISPEIIYFTRTYKAAPAGSTLENALVDRSAAAGGDYAKVNWQVKPAGDNIYEIAALIPSRAGSLTYTFIVDYGKKTILPGDDFGKMVLDSITPRQPAPRGKAGRKKAGAKAQAQAQPARTAAKAAAKPAKAAAKGAAADEYEYVYEDDDGTGK